MSRECDLPKYNILQNGMVQSLQHDVHRQKMGEQGSIHAVTERSDLVCNHTSTQEAYYQIRFHGSVIQVSVDGITIMLSLFAWF